METVVALETPNVPSTIRVNQCASAIELLCIPLSANYILPQILRISWKI